MQHTIKVTIPNDLEKPVEVTVDGVTGPTCEGLAEPFTQGLGAITEDTPTDEYYEGVGVWEGETQDVGGW
jgi:hypothetical protein